MSSGRRRADRKPGKGRRRAVRRINLAAVAVAGCFVASAAAAPFAAALVVSPVARHSASAHHGASTNLDKPKPHRGLVIRMEHRVASSRDISDTYTSAGTPNLRHGHYHRLITTNKRHHRKVAFIKFRVTGLPRNGILKSATIEFTRYRHRLPASRLDLHRVNPRGWSQRTLTQRREPRLGRLVATRHVRRGSTTVTFSIKHDITGDGLYAFALTTHARHVVRFQSREDAKAPTLKLNYVVPVLVISTGPAGGSPSPSPTPTPTTSPSDPPSSSPSPTPPPTDSPSTPPTSAPPTPSPSDSPSSSPSPSTSAAPSPTPTPTPTPTVSSTPTPTPTPTVPSTPTPSSTPTPTPTPTVSTPTPTPTPHPDADSDADPDPDGDPDPVDHPDSDSDADRVDTPTPTTTPTPTPTPTFVRKLHPVDHARTELRRAVRWVLTSLGGTDIMTASQRTSTPDRQHNGLAHDYRRPGQVLSPYDIQVAQTPGDMLQLNWKPANTWSDADGRQRQRQRPDRRDGQQHQVAGNRPRSSSRSSTSPRTTCPAAAPAAARARSTRAAPVPPRDYRAMWANVEARFAALNVTNVVWVMNYMGYAGWDCMVDDLWPGNSLVDWVFWDPYSEQQPDLLTQTVSNFYNLLTSMSDSTHNYLSKPWGLGEFGSTADQRRQPGELYYSGVEDTRWTPTSSRS